MGVLGEKLTDFKVFPYKVWKILLGGIPARIPIAGDGKAETGWMNFLSHNEIGVVFNLGFVCKDDTNVAGRLFVRMGGTASSRTEALKCRPLLNNSRLNSQGV